MIASYILTYFKKCLTQTESSTLEIDEIVKWVRIRIRTMHIAIAVLLIVSDVSFPSALAEVSNAAMIITTAPSPIHKASSAILSFDMLSPFSEKQFTVSLIYYHILAKKSILFRYLIICYISTLI